MTQIVDERRADDQPDGPAHPPADGPDTATRRRILDQFARVRRGAAEGRLRDLDDRATQLRQLRRFLVDDEELIDAALHADLGKSPIEAYTTEIGFVMNDIDDTLKHLRSWAAGSKVGVPLHLRPGSARIVPEPLGTVLIIAPWNYPLQLLLAPLVPALAAGNTVVLKPSEIAPATAELIARRLPNYLDEDVVQVVLGAVPETTVLLDQPFDHIFYTGNGTVGKVVLRAAAEHLTPVTLELGGKSPAIVAADADLEVSARRIAWGKFLNAGQTCVAPDYVLVDRQVHAPFMTALSAAIVAFYGDDPRTSPDYGRIVSQRHLERLAGLLDAGGDAVIVHGGVVDPDMKYISPTVVAQVDPDSPLMRDEIFGPILPVLTFTDLDEAIAFVTDRPKPLALYVFSSSDRTVERVLDRTSSGGVTVNHTLLHLAVTDLPFGGVGPSGMGSYHGEAGFRRFSHMKSILRRGTFPDPSLAYPPYTGLKGKLLRRLL